MPAATGVCRRVRLRTDVRIPGSFRLTLSGDAGSFRVWKTARPSGDDPLPVADGSLFGSVQSEGDLDLFVEAVSNGSAELSYSYTGTGERPQASSVWRVYGRCACLETAAVRADMVFEKTTIRLSAWHPNGSPERSR
jgi:hypothetical protein